MTFLDHEGDEPLYAQVARILIARIDSGEYPPRRPIPSKRLIVQEMGVAAGTVERALDELRKLGMLRSVRGRGLYVVPPSQRKPQRLPPTGRPRSRGR